MHEGLKGIAMTKEEIEAANGRNEKLGRWKGFDFRNCQDSIDKFVFNFARSLGHSIYDGLCIEDNMGNISNLSFLERIGYVLDREWELSYDCKEKHPLAYKLMLEECEKVKFIPLTKFTGLFKYPFDYGIKGHGYDGYVSGWTLQFFPLDYHHEFERKSYYKFDSEKNKWVEGNGESSEYEPIIFEVLIPKDEIAKYSNFKVVKK